jgi:hypothetical protein
MLGDDGKDGPRSFDTSPLPSSASEEDRPEHLVGPGPPVLPEGPWWAASTVDVCAGQLPQLPGSAPHDPHPPRLAATSTIVPNSAGCRGAPTRSLVQRAVVEVLNPIYETDFLGFSYGFRPGRSQHDALDALTAAIRFKR